MQTPVQFRVNKNHGALYDLVKRLSEVKEKGYMAEQLRARLIAFETLARMTGEDDPFEVVAKMSAAWYLTHTTIEGAASEKVEREESVFDDDILAMADMEF